MTTQYSPLLGLALPVTGELSGTWGDVVNDSITSLVEDSVANFATNNVTSADWTLTTTGSGATNQARMMILIATGTPGVARNIIAPSSSKMYLVVNLSNSSVTVKGSATTGVVVPALSTAVVAWVTSDFIVISDVVGANASTNNAIAAYNGTSGKVLKNTGVTIDGSNNVTIPGQADLRLADSDSSHYIALQAPATVTTNVTLTLPDGDGDASQVLTTNGSGVLSWTTPASAGITTGKAIAMAMIFGF